MDILPTVGSEISKEKNADWPGPINPETFNESQHAENENYLNQLNYRTEIKVVNTKANYIIQYNRMDTSLEWMNGWQLLAEDDLPQDTAQ